MIRSKEVSGYLYTLNWRGASGHRIFSKRLCSNSYIEGGFYLKSRNAEKRDTILESLRMNESTHGEQLHTEFGGPKGEYST